MTGFLASISSVDEARQVRFLGVDVIDLKDPNKGALGALDEDSVRSIAALIGNRTTLSATIGDLPSLCGRTGERRHKDARLRSRHCQGGRI